MLTIKVILGSTRPNRFGPQPAEWIMKLSQAYDNKATFELVDLEQINLPFLDIPNPTSTYGTQQNEHQIAWSKIISEADGFVFVTPEYNHGVPAAFKNAFDYLWSEWHYKPVAFLGYGADAGGARSIEHWRQIVGWAQMYDISEHIILPQYYLNLDEQGRYKFDEQQENKAKDMLEKLIFWAAAMKPAREQLVNNAAK